MLAVIRDSGRLLVSVINDVLDFSRLDAGKVTLEHAAFSPADLARQVGAVHAVAAAEKGLALTIDAAPAAGAARLGDAMRIAQVLHNLLGNAVKFTEAGAITLSVAADAAGATFTVRDQGIGMTADQAARVFDAFAQADSSITRRFGGAGLGLAIVKQLVDAMGGTIALDTAPQQGA
ncbi:MAG: hybrid sensor histidine kinase/response regulator, partial [Rhodobacterales bacterium CG_4_9_14_3_um_filter_71_31]